jgi:hypothetical protein
MWSRSPSDSGSLPGMFERAVLLVAAALALSCAPTQPVKKKAPPPPDPVLTTEQMAYQAEREINSAETELTALQPDKAEEHLDAARKVLFDAKIDSYPDAAELRSRHKELVDRVPAVREEVKKRELAAKVKEAKDKIDVALASLKDALVQIKKKRPEEADLKLAEDSVQTVETTLQEANELESADKEYGKYALNVRKLLSTHKKTVVDRRLQVAIDLEREEIQNASNELDAALKALRGRDPPKDDFDRARAAVDTVQKTIEGAADLMVKDLAFAKQVGAQKKKLEGQRDLIAKREHEVAVDRQRASVEQAKKTMFEALNRIRSKDAVEADFTEAEAAVNGVSQVLTDGGPLAAKDTKYAAYATGVKAKVDESKTKIEARKLEVEIAKEKTTIEGARIALGEALFRLKAPSPAEGEFEEAKNAIGTVEKALDSAEKLTPKDKDFSRYVLDVHKGLQSARSTIDQRKFAVELGLQKAKVNEANAAMKSATARMSSPEDFDAAEKTVADLEKALDEGESYSAKDRAYSKFALDVRKQAAKMRGVLKLRRENFAVDTQKAKVSEAMAALKAAVDPLDGFSPGEEHFAAAAEALAAANKALEEGIDLEVKVGRYKTWAEEPRKKVKESAERVETRRIQITVRERKLLVEDGLAALKAGLAAVNKKDASQEQLKEAETSVATVKEEINKGTDLELKDADYRKFASGAKKQVQEYADALEDAKQTMSFRDGPIASLNEGLEMVKSAKGLEPADEQKAYKTALEHFRACQQNGASILAEHPRVAAKPFVVAGKPAKAKDVLGKCAEQSKGLDAKVAQLDATVAFYSGPAKELETGKGFLADADAADTPEAKKKAYSGALTAFEKCVELGKTLEHKQPEMKKKKFDVGGKSVTLALVLAACQKGAKTSRDSMNAK